MEHRRTLTEFAPMITRLPQGILRRMAQPTLVLFAAVSVSCVSVGDRIRRYLAADFAYEQKWHAMPKGFDAYLYSTPANYAIWNTTFLEPHFQGCGYDLEERKALLGVCIPKHLKYVDTSRLIKEAHFPLTEMERLLREEGLSATSILCLPVWFGEEWGEGAVDYEHWINRLMNDPKIRKSDLAAWRYSTVPNWRSGSATFRFTNELGRKTLRRYP